MAYKNIEQEIRTGRRNQGQRNHATSPVSAGQVLLHLADKTGNTYGGRILRAAEQRLAYGEQAVSDGSTVGQWEEARR